MVKENLICDVAFWFALSPSIPQSRKTIRMIYWKCFFYEFHFSFGEKNNSIFARNIHSLSISRASLLQVWLASKLNLLFHLDRRWKIDTPSTLRPSISRLMALLLSQYRWVLILLVVIDNSGGIVYLAVDVDPLYAPFFKSIIYIHEKVKMRSISKHLRSVSHSVKSSPIPHRLDRHSLPWQFDLYITFWISPNLPWVVVFPCFLTRLDHLSSCKLFICSTANSTFALKNVKSFSKSGSSAHERLILCISFHFHCCVSWLCL